MNLDCEWPEFPANFKYPPLSIRKLQAEPRPLVVFLFLGWVLTGPFSH